MSGALSDIIQELVRQDAKWGEQNHNPYIYLAILLEEIGELAQSILHSQFGGDKENDRGGFANLRKEAVHVAAVSIAIVECLDRNKWISNDVNLISLKDELKRIGGNKPKPPAPPIPSIPQSENFYNNLPFKRRGKVGD